MFARIVELKLVLNVDKSLKNFAAVFVKTVYNCRALDMSAKKDAILAKITIEILNSALNALFQYVRAAFT